MMVRPRRTENRMTLTASLRFPLMAVFREKGMTFSRKTSTRIMSSNPTATAATASTENAWSDERSMPEN